MGVIRKALPLLLCVALLFADDVSGRQRRHAVEREVPDLRSQLESIRMNSIKTIRFANGDVYDCVDIFKQPAFLHPKLKDHKLQMRPSVFPAGPSSTTGEEDVGGLFSDATTSSEDECPQGSVPIHRLDLDAMAGDTLVFGSKDTGDGKADNWYSRFWATTRAFGALYGSGAAINTYAVPNVGPIDNSAAVMWVTRDDIGVSLKTGWQVKPQLYNDTQTRLFAEWTVDNDRTFCTNTACAGFVVINPKPTLGMVLKPLSTYMGQQYVARVYIYRDPETGDWWLGEGLSRTLIGYWPKVVLNNVENATRVDFGGFVNCAPNKRCPPIGNGVVPGAIRQGVDRACFITEVQYYNKYGGSFYFTKGQTAKYVSDTSFSNVGDFQYDGHNFTFGGPGY